MQNASGIGFGGSLNSSFILSAIRLQYSQSLPYVILLLAVLLLLILWVYPPQLGHVPRRIRWVLSALRITGVFAIGLSILRPVMSRSRRASERAPVVVLLDDSASMGVIDSSRPAAEWVGIAAAMGRLPADVRDKQIDALQASCDRLSAKADEVIRARAELDYARLSGRGIDQAQTRLDQTIDEMQLIAHDAAAISAVMHVSGLDRTLAYLVHMPAGVDRQAWLDRIRDRARAAASYAEQVRISSDGQLFGFNDTVRDACRGLQSLSRLALAETAVLDPADGLAARLGNDTAVLGYGISDHVVPIQLNDRQPLVAEGSVSNLTGGIRAVLESLKSAPPRAVVLFSDGRANNADTDSATLASLQSIPIFTVATATRAGLRDLSITNATLASTAGVGESVTLNAEVRCFSGVRGVTTTATVTGGGEDETRPITFSDDRPISLTFNRQFTSLGLQRVTLEIAPIPNEISYQNNKVERWINVYKQPAKPGATTHPATRPSAEAEWADLTGDEFTLRRLAEASGGQFLRLDQIDLLPKRLNELRDDVSHPVEIPLWDGTYFFMLVLGCLATEWGLRKRYGLA